MKYCLIIPDGMAGWPIEELQNKTPLQTANTPNMNRIAEDGIVGNVQTIPKGIAPGSDVANLSILGYDPKQYYTGRAPLEAINIGIEMGPDDVAFRCNLVTVTENHMADYSAGHISQKEAVILIDLLNEKFASSDVKFYAGTSYRHIMIYSGNEEIKLKTVPPHDIIEKPLQGNLPTGKGSKVINSIMAESQKILIRHEINNVRVDLGENPANMIWLWGEGKPPALPPFQEKYNKRGAAISAVDLIKGIAKCVGWDAIEVEGATGYYNTNYMGKGLAAINALRDYDIVLVHIEAPDEASHNGNFKEKIYAIQEVDRKIVGPVYNHLKETGDFRIIVLPDHPTPVRPLKKTKP